MVIVTPQQPSSQDPTATATYAAVDTEVAAIKAKTDALPAAPAAQAKLDTLHDTRIPGVIQAQTGDAFARLGAPVGASISADLAVVDGLLDVPAADTANDITIRDVVGRKTDAGVVALGATKSVMAYLKGILDLSARTAVKAAAVIVDADTLFTVAGGPIEVEALWSECITANDGTASTLQYSATPTVGSAQTISGASASLANAAAGASVSLIGTALSTAALYNANGPNLGMTPPGGVIVPAGTIKAVVGVGSTTGTWRHYLRYRPLTTGVTVT